VPCLPNRPDSPDVLAAARCSSRVAAEHESAVAVLLQRGAAVTIADAPQRLCGRELLQREGLKLVQQTAKTKDGFKHISAIRGAWI
jgi:hypothetical protein